MDSEGLKGALNVIKTIRITNYAITLIFAVLQWLKGIVYLLFANVVGSLCRVFRTTKDQSSFSPNLTVRSLADE
jgi:hypothetical protein